MGERRRDKGSGMVRWRSDGRWEGRFVDADGRRRAVYVRTPGKPGRRECERLLADQIAQAAAGLRPSRQPLADYLARWVARNRAIAPQSAARYRDLVRIHVAPSAAGRIELIRLQPEDLEDLYADRLDAGCSPKSIELIHTVIRGALGTAARRGHVMRDVAALVRPPKVTRHEFTALSAGDVVRLLDGSGSDRLEALWTLAVATGMRQGELLALRWPDVAEDYGSITLRRGSEGETKTGAGRHLRLAARAARSLRAHRARQAAEQLAAHGAYEEFRLVFASPWGTQLDPRRVREAFARACRRAGVPAVRFHDLRHSASTLLLEQGVPTKVVSEILGHADTRTTLEIYAHVTETMQDQAVAAMDRALGG